MYAGLDNELLSASDLQDPTADLQETDQRLYSYVDNRTRGGANSNWQQGNELTMMTEDELRNEFNASDNDELQRAFGSFDNYLAYMNEREDLIDAGEIRADWWNAEYETTQKQGEVIVDGVNILEGIDAVDLRGFTEDGKIKDANKGYEEMAAVLTPLFEKYASPEAKHYTYAGNLQAQNQDGDGYIFNGSSWVKTSKVDDHAGVGDYLKVAAIAGAAILTGGAASSALAGAGWGAGVSGAVGGAVGSLVSGAINGDITPEGLLTGAVLGGIGGLSQDLLNGALAGTELDEAIWGMSDVLQTDYETTLNILTGAATGAINGGDLEGIVAGAVGTLGTSKVMDYLKDSFGNTVDIDDWFKDGDSNIPVEAFKPIVEQVVTGIADGTITDTGDWGKALFDYFNSGGDIDFALPGAGEGDWKEWMAIYLPDVGLPDIDLPDIDLPDVDLPDVDLPEVDLPEVDIDLPEVDIDLPEVDVDLPEVDLPEVDVDLPEVDIDTPDVDIDTPDVDLPDLDVDLPEVGLPKTGFAKGMMSEPQWGELFAYTTITPQQAAKLAPYKDMIQKGRGMFS